MSGKLDLHIFRSLPFPTWKTWIYRLKLFCNNRIMSGTGRFAGGAPGLSLEEAGLGLYILFYSTSTLVEAAVTKSS